jgi:hypothetical protein
LLAAYSKKIQAYAFRMKNHFEYFLAPLFLKVSNYAKLLSAALCSLFVLSQVKMTTPTHREYHSSIELLYISESRIEGQR